MEIKFTEDDIDRIIMRHVCCDYTFPQILTDNKELVVDFDSLYRTWTAKWVEKKEIEF